MTAMVELDRLTKVFGDFRAVDGISLTVKKGEVLGFLGPNGAGKTTTMRMAAGFLSPTSGTARICGHDVTADPISVKRVLGYMAEGSPSYDDMSVGAFLAFIAEVRGLDGAAKDERIKAVASRLGLDAMMERPIEILSKGYKRRVGLAQAILHDPPALILDEPTDGLDPNQKHQVRALISEMASEKVIIVSTHLLEEVEAVCTRAVIIGHGRLLADGTAQELLTRLPDYHAVSVILPAASAKDAAGKLRVLPAVAAVFETPVGGDRTKLRLTPKNGAVILDAVVKAVREQNIPASEIYRDHGNLDDVFRLITTGAAARPAA